MLFKRLHRATAWGDKENKEHENTSAKHKDANVGETATVSEDELATKRLKLWKKQQRKRRIKKVVIWLFLLLAVIGGYKSLFETEPAVKREELSDSVFVTSYVEAYLEYPQSEASKKLVDTFTLKNEEQSSYDGSVESVKVNDINFYKVKSLSNKKGYRYYAEVFLTVTQNKQTPMVETRYLRLDVAKENNRYLVIAPPLFTSYDVKAIRDEDIKNNLSLEMEKTNQSLNEAESKQLSETLTLFFKTYSDDYKQAKLLTSGSNVMDTLDPKVKMKFTTITSATKDEDTTYVQVKVEESDGYTTRTRNYYIEINNENNKIKKLEVY